MTGGPAWASGVAARRRELVHVSPDALVVTRPFSDAQSLPYVVEPVVAGLDLVGWLERDAQVLETLLRAHGALLLRGFGALDVTAFERAIHLSSGDLLEYVNRSTPRSRIAGRIFSSTEYPADQSIPLHNELSYNRRWPSRLFFLCVVPPTQGGETPIADSRRVLARIPASVRRRFERHGVCYVRNYGLGIDLSWQDVFQTTDPQAVNAYCREAGITAHWSAAGLRTIQVCQATVAHPSTTERVWFNQAHLFHVSALPAEVRSELEALGQLPRMACFGDWSPISEEDLDAVRRAYVQEETLFRWQEHDILVVDNVMMAHGRRPYAGSRRILVGMT